MRGRTDNLYDMVGYLSGLVLVYPAIMEVDYRRQDIKSPPDPS